jgi:hypothetical protein
MAADRSEDANFLSGKMGCCHVIYDKHHVEQAGARDGNVCVLVISLTSLQGDQQAKVHQATVRTAPRAHPHAEKSET